jgi:hypothetical protein
VHDANPESVRAFSVDPAYQRLWLRRAGVCLAVGVGLIAVGVALFAAGFSSGVPLAVLGVLCLPVGALIGSGVRTTRARAYRLEVGPDGLTVIWRDQSTHLPWALLEYATVTRNGPLSTDLEVRPRPDFRPVLPDNARPRTSKRTPGLLSVFSLDLLGPAQADCLGEVASYIELR